MQVELLAAEAHRPPENAAQHVPPALVAGHGTVGQRERQAAEMVGDDAEGDVDAKLRIGRFELRVGGIGRRELARVLSASRSARCASKMGREQVGAVVVVLVLEHLADALQAHAGVHVLGGQGREFAGGVAVVLDEDEVPDFHDAGVGAVDQAGRRTSSAVRSMWISVQGPQGPVSPISQKLSLPK